MNTSLEMNPESYDYEKSFSTFECFFRIQNLSTDFGIACDDMIDQLVTIQLISGILKDIKKEAKDDDVDLLLKSFCYCEEIECTSSCSFKTQKICAAKRISILAEWDPTCNSE